MSELINAQGLGCAEPIILAKKALELYDEITIIVDARTALENLRALGNHLGCLIRVTTEIEYIYTVHFRKNKG